MKFNDSEGGFLIFLFFSFSEVLCTEEGRFLRPRGETGRPTGLGVEVKGRVSLRLAGCV